MLAITTTIDGVRFEVQLAPRASRNAVIGEHDGALKIAITAPPVEGAANAALVAFLAEHLGLAQRDVRITRGQSSRRKTIEVRGVTVEAVAALVAPTLTGASSSVRKRK